MPTAASSPTRGAGPIDRGWGATRGAARPRRCAARAPCRARAPSGSRPRTRTRMRIATSHGFPFGFRMRHVRRSAPIFRTRTADTSAPEDDDSARIRADDPSRTTRSAPFVQPAQSPAACPPSRPGVLFSRDRTRKRRAILLRIRRMLRPQSRRAPSRLPRESCSVANRPLLAGNCERPPARLPKAPVAAGEFALPRNPA
jgi:hypothetical protein